MSATTTGRMFGSGIRRREDPRLITGTARYTDDITLPGMVHAAMLRSPHAHAKDPRHRHVGRGEGAPGCSAYTNADIEGHLKPMPCLWLVPGPI
jgi:carbon-monoxide dehydrogenase large subunit